MKAYKVTLLIIDHDKIGTEGILENIENTNYANDCIAPEVIGVEERDIGEWSDDHPLNCADTSDAEVKRLFGEVGE